MASTRHKKDHAKGPKLVGPPPLGRRFLRWAIRLFLLGITLLALTVAGGYWYFSQGLPDFDKVTDYRPAQVSRVFAADGTLLTEFGSERRTVIGRDQMPEVLVQAVLAAEDADFFKHEGLDYMGMGRALYNSLRAGRVTGSGSTITQQTVKNLVLTSEKSFGRKAREIILTRRLEKRLTKDDILAIYLNTIYLGHGRYGVQEAARFYFGKDARDLNLNESAILAGIIQSPERHSPRKHYEAAVSRRAYVLGQMARNGFITPAVEAETNKLPIALAELPPERVDSAMWFVNIVRHQVLDRLGEAALYQGGLRIHTTLDIQRQTVAHQVLREGLREVDVRQKYAKPLENISEADAEYWRKKRRSMLQDRPPPDERPVPARIVAMTPKGLVVEFGVGTALIDAENAARFASPEGKLPFQVGEVYDVAVRADGPKHPERMQAVLSFAPQGAMVVLDPRDRSVLALVGGYSYSDYPFDRATQARRQPGSAFKPFVFGAALESHRYTPATVMIDAPETYQVQAGKWWKPRNYDGDFIGDVNIRTALARSINSVAIKITDDVGYPAVQAFARRAGITSPLADNLTVALGSSEVSPLELTNAFATLAADGSVASPLFIRSIEGPSGPIPFSPSEDAEDAPDQALPPDVTWLVRSLMRSVVTAGSGTKLKGLPRTIIGKTGTSNDARDTWFVGLLPDVVVTAWVGFDTPQSLGRKETGGRTAAPIVRAYLDQLERTGADWPTAPAGIVVAEIDPVTGLRATDETPNKYTEYFLKGTVPTEQATNQGEVDAGSFMLNQFGLGDAPDEPGLAVVPVPTGLVPDGMEAGLPPPRLEAGDDLPDEEEPAPPRNNLAPLAPVAARRAEPARPPGERPISVPTIAVVELPELPDTPDLPPLDAPEPEDEDEDRPDP